MSQVGLECKLARNYTMENVERAQALLLVKAIPDKTIDFGVLPLNIVVVIDISGSMSGEKIEFAKEAACLVVDSVSEQDWIAVTVFDDEAQVIVPSRKADDKGAIKSHIRRIETEDGTCMYTGMRAGAREIAKQASRSNLSRMLLLTDGQTVGEDECLDIARREAKNKLVISTFGIGDDYNEDLLKDIAEVALGGAYHLQDPRQIKDQFKTELETATATGITRASLTFQLAKGVTLEELHRITPHIARLELHPADERTMAADVGDLEKSEVTTLGAKLTLPSRQSSRVRVAQVTLRYDIPSLEVRESIERHDVVVEYTRDRDLCGKVDSEVMHYFNQMSVQGLVEEATRDAKAGNIAGATQKLAQAQMLTQRIGNVAMTVSLKQAMDELEKKGTISAGAVKTIRLGSTHTVRLEETS